MPYVRRYPSRRTFRSRTRSIGSHRRTYVARPYATRTVGRSRFRRYRRRSLIRRPLPATQSFPNFTKFTYHDVNFTNALNAGNLYQSLQVFRGNSLYDPDFTGVGLTAYYLPEILGNGKFYYLYCVMASKITLYMNVVNTADGSTADISKVRVVCFPSSSSAPPVTTLGECDMQPGVRRCCISGDTGRRWKLKNYATSCQQLVPGRPTDIEWFGTDGTSPNRQWYWYLLFNGADLSKTTTVHYDVKITYYTKLVDRSVVQY